jgi:excisionase family DNA binding protein
LLSVLEVAALLQVPVKTLYQWRFRGEGPIAMRIGRYLRFDPRDVEAWVESRKAR